MDQNRISTLLNPCEARSQNKAMLLFVLLVVGGVSYTRADASLPPHCPQGCECEPLTLQCVARGIPQLGENITAFQLKNAQPPIPELTTVITTKLQQLESFDLDGAGLVFLHPGALGFMEHLEQLSLTNNNITGIRQYTFNNCPKLETILLDNNNIRIIADDVFAAIPRLKKLSLSHNRLHVLPHPLPPHLESFSAHHNYIQEVPRLILQNLTSLNLCHNLIQLITPDQIDLKNLKELCLGGSKFVLNDELLHNEQFPVLESLHLEGTPDYKITVDDNILWNIQRMSTISLHTLKLDFCSISTLKPFGSMTKLHTLSMINVTADIFSTRIKIPFTLPKIAVLDFSGSPVLAEDFLTSYTTGIFDSLKILRMSWCRITSFPRSLQMRKAPNITHLDLSFNPLHCTCDLSWIPNDVREGRLQLENERNTTCIKPAHLRNIPLLTATLCPASPTPSTTVTISIEEADPVTSITTTTTTTTTSSYTEVFPEWSTESLGGSSKTNSSHAESSPPGVSKAQILFIVLGSFGAVFLLSLIVLGGSCVLRHYKARKFHVSRIS